MFFSEASESWLVLHQTNRLQPRQRFYNDAISADFRPRGSTSDFDADDFVCSAKLTRSNSGGTPSTCTSDQLRHWCRRTRSKQNCAGRARAEFTGAT
jgi:hypothetical protein